MEKKVISVIMLTLLLISMFTLAFNIQPLKAEPTTWTVDDDGPADFSSIQEAIGSPDVKDGDTIFVYNGTYYENIVVDKTVLLIGENKNTSVIVGVVLSPVWESVISVRADDVRIANFTVTNGGHGIYLGARRCIVTDCVAYENHFGLTISSSSQNLLRRNQLFNNSYNLNVLGAWSINDFMQDIDTSNFVNGKPVYYLVNKENLSINPVSFPNIGYLGVVNSINVQIANFSLSKNGDGLLIAFSPNTLIENVEATHNYHGISLMCSPRTTVKCCNFSYNDLGIFLYYSDYVNVKESDISHNEEGIFLMCSSYGVIYHNNLIENYRYYQARVDQSYNCHWDGGYPSGGNYWSDYTGVDVYSGPNQDQPGSDGKGDTPYVIDEDNRDNYPLMNPWTPTPLVVEATVDINPQALNLKSKGKWITCYIELSEGYNVGDIVVSWIRLNNTVPVEQSCPIAIGDYDNDALPDLMVKFDRAYLMSLIIGEMEIEERFTWVTLRITGNLNDGIPFQGSTTIKIIDIARIISKILRYESYMQRF